MIYRIYGNNRLHGWKLLTLLYQEELIGEFVAMLSSEDFDKVMVVSYDVEFNQDILYDVIYLEKGLTRKK